VIGAVIGTLALVFHRPLLRTAASLWIVEGKPFDRADFGVIPGGGLETRPFAAADLFHAGRVTRLLTFTIEPSPVVELGLQSPEHELTLSILEELEIPRASIDLVEAEVTSTWDEVVAVRGWCEKNRIRSLVVFTDLFPSRRIRWAYRRGLAGLDLDLHVVPVPPLRYTADTWWQHEQGLIDFQNEVVKYLYYRMRY